MKVMLTEEQKFDLDLFVLGAVVEDATKYYQVHAAARLRFPFLSARAVDESFRRLRRAGKIEYRKKSSTHPQGWYPCAG